MPSTTENFRSRGRSQRSYPSTSSASSSFGRGLPRYAKSSSANSATSRSSSSAFSARNEQKQESDSQEYSDYAARDFQNLSLADSHPSVVRGGDVRVSDSYGTRGRTIPASCNYIRLDFLNADNSIKEYTVTFEPNVDSVRERFYLTRKFFKSLGGRIHVYDGSSQFCTPEELPDEVNETSIKLSSGLEVKVCLKFTRIKKLEESAHILSTIFKRIMNSLEFVRFRRADFNPKAAFSIPQHQLKIWPGYVTHVSNCESGIMLCCDTSFRVLRTETCFDIIRDILHTGSSRSCDCKDEIMQTFIGTSVITNYNQKETYIIDDVDFISNPRSTFTKGGQEISYVEYYRTHYNVIIQDEGQPLFVHRVRRKEMGKEKMICLIYLIPELCSPTGITDSMKSNFKVMKDIRDFTQASPTERQAALSKLIQEMKNSEKARQYLSDWNLELPNTTIDLIARVLEPPQLFFGARKTTYEEKAEWGRTASNSKVLNAVSLNRWGVIYVRRNDRIVNEFLECFTDVARRVGIEACMPKMFALPDENIKCYTDELKRLAPQRPQILVIVFPSIREDRYKAVKKLCNTELGILTQVINSRTISNRNSLRSVVCKVVLQINCKVGGALWGVSLPYAEEGLMIAGIDVFNDKDRRNKSVIALVSSTNSACTQWTSTTAEQNRGQCISDTLLPMMVECLESWKKKNRTYPSIVIVYRLGVSDGSLNVFKDFEVPQLLNAFEHVQPGYRPHLTYIAVLRQISTRLYQKDRNTFSNPPAGCVVDTQITNKGLNEFFLVPQHCHRGTASPTRFIIITNSFLSMNIIEDVTYKMTCMYYNWSGAVNIPAPCMYARKLATLVGEHMHGPATENLKDTTFFL